MTELSQLADELLEAIALEDMKSFQKNGFYTTFTKAGDCKVLVFDLPNEQKKLEDFNLWRTKQWQLKKKRTLLKKWHH